MDIIVERFGAWQSPLFISQYPEYRSQETKVCALIESLSERQDHVIDSQIAVSAKHRLLESDLNFLSNPSKLLLPLTEFFKDAVLYAAYEANQDCWHESVDPEVTILESWYHITESGGYHDAHSHPNCSWCGIYYLASGESDLNDQNGVNRFYDPRANAGHYQDLGTSYLNHEGFWDIAPQNGQLVIFPSYLKHAALPYYGEEKRIVIAFNCRVEARNN